MSAQEAEIVKLEQLELFQPPKIRKPKDGALSLSHVRKVLLPAEQTAELLKREDMGRGSEVSIVGGSGTIGGIILEGDTVVWKVDVGDVQVEL